MNNVRLIHVVGIVALVSSLSLSSCDLWNQLFPPSVVGTWRQDVSYTGVPSGYPTTFRFEFTFNADNTMESDLYVVPPGGTQYVLFDGSVRGTYSISKDVLTITVTEAYTVTDQATMTGSWSAASDTGEAQFSINGKTMTLTEDLDKNGQFDTSHPIEDTYPGGGGTVTDVTLTLTKVS